MRNAIRVRLVLYGLCALSALSVIAFLAAAALDWLLWLPALLRAAVGASFVVVFVTAALRWVVRPAQARLGLDEIAARVEAHFGTLQDRLTSTVDFLLRGEAGSESMMRQVVFNTEQHIADLPLEASMTIRPLMRQVAFLAVSLSVLTSVLLASPGWARTGIYRYIYPWGRIEWPRDTTIMPLTGDLIAAVGESVTVRMAVRRGLHGALRGTVHLEEPDGGTMALAMQRDREQPGRFHATIDVVTKDLKYWFEAGDDSTKSRRSTIRVVPRPGVVEAIASVEPPPYASHAQARISDLADGPVQAPIGGWVEIAVRASKPLPPGRGEATAGLRLEDDRMIPMLVDPVDHQRLRSRFEVREDLRFRIELRDAEGFENRGAVDYTVLATPDMPPNVAVLEPRATAELTPRGTIPMFIRAEDDFGVTGLTLAAERIGGGTHRTPLSDAMQVTPGDAGIEAIVRHVWSVEPLSLSPGDLLLYHVEATDNFPNPDGTGQIGRSSTMRIRIISEVEFDIRLRSDLARLEARLRQAALDEIELLDRTTSLIKRDDPLPPLTDKEHETITSTAGDQARLVGRLRDLAQRFRQLTDQMIHNRSGEEGMPERIRSIEDALEQIASGPMSEARAALERVRERTDMPAQQAALGDAAREEQAAVDQLQALIARMSEWGSFHELTTRTRDLLDRQEELRRQTADLGRTTLGRPVESLTEPETAALRRTGRQQEQLATDLEQLLARMRQLAASARPQDRAAAEAVDAALRAARARDLGKNVDRAVSAIEANRTAAATMAQRAVSDAIREMAAALRQRDRHRMAELEELRKRLEGAEEQIKQLIEEQEALRLATQEAGLMGADEPTYRDYAERQRTLRRNTRLLGDEMAGSEQTMMAADPLRKAATHMQQAEGLLGDQQPEAATGGQDKALLRLNEALARLQELARETEREALLRSLDQIREDLEGMLTAQREVNAGIGRLKNTIDERGRVGRAEARAATRLARQQADIRSTLESQAGDFRQVIVYDWALTRVGQWMDESRERLTAREIDDRLVGTTDRIVRELEMLVGAIAQTKTLPVDMDFIESDRGGGGQGRGGMIQYKPVPTVAELLVLKAMQTDINDRTQQVQASLDLEHATESELRELRILGEDQGEVRQLTERLTNRARLP
jgi:hypothetical protein